MVKCIKATKTFSTNARFRKGFYRSLSAVGRQSSNAYQQWVIAIEEAVGRIGGIVLDKSFWGIIWLSLYLNTYPKM